MSDEERKRIEQLKVRFRAENEGARRVLEELEEIRRRYSETLEIQRRLDDALVLQAQYILLRLRKRRGRYSQN